MKNYERIKAMSVEEMAYSLLTADCRHIVHLLKMENTIQMMFHVKMALSNGLIRR